MFKKLILAVAALPLLAACSDSTGPGNGTSNLTVMLTDGPGDFVSAVVTIDGVYLQGGDGGSQGRVWLSQTPVTTDLLTLSNDVTSLVDNVEVPSGNYADLRFVISGAYVEVDNGDETTSIYATPGYDQLPEGRTADGMLTMPSYSESGLKVNFDGGAVNVSGTQEIVLVDFDVAQSFGHVAGGSGSWVMDPVVRGANIELTAGATVTLALADGVTLPELNGVQVALSDFTAVLDDGMGNTKEAAFADVDGVFTASFPYLMPGETWHLSVNGPDGLTFEIDPTLPIDVATSSGQEAQFDLTVTSAALATP